MALETDVVAIQTSVEALVADAAGIVAGSLTPTLDGLRADIEVAGAGVECGRPRRSPANVARQRQSFDLVLNGAR